ncbi:MAG: hypothetical protein KDB14_20120 [Planctomycetales bacterium]|nr:hypothetical protein [Planctomycetales bacterium]
MRRNSYSLANVHGQPRLRGWPLLCHEQYERYSDGESVSWQAVFKGLPICPNTERLDVI